MFNSKVRAGMSMVMLRGKTTFDPEDMPNWLASIWPRHEFGTSLLTAINDDDCAVMRTGSSLLVVTMDFVNSHPIVMELGIGSWDTLGRLVVAANLSDLCGTGAKPVAMLIGITMPYDSRTEHFKRIIRGIRQETKRYGIPVIGGDTKLGRSFAIVGVGMGSACSSKNLFLKNGARPGDLVWTSGCLGSCAAAVVGLKENVKDNKWSAWAKRVLSVPNVPIEKSLALSDLRLGHGGTDISDGLGVTIHNLCDQSDTGAIIYADQIPVATPVLRIAKGKGISPWAFSFASGGEFQFLATTSPRSETKLRELGFHLIGRITKSRTRSIRIAHRGDHALPSTGHRDSRQLTFYDEILRLAQEVDHV